jgi:hypothetical protein
LGKLRTLLLPTGPGTRSRIGRGPWGVVTGVIDWKARTFFEDSISSSTHKIHTETVSTCTWWPYLPCFAWAAFILITLTSKRTSA